MILNLLARDLSRARSTPPLDVRRQAFMLDKQSITAGFLNPEP